MGDTQMREPTDAERALTRLKYGPPITEQLADLTQRVEAMEAIFQAIAAGTDPFAPSRPARPVLRRIK